MLLWLLSSPSGTTFPLTQTYFFLSYILVHSTCLLQHQHLVLSCGAAAAINVLFHSIIPADSEIIIIAPFFAEYLRYIENVNSKAVIVPASLTFAIDACIIIILV